MNQSMEINEIQLGVDDNNQNNTQNQNQSNIIKFNIQLKKKILIPGQEKLRY